MPAMRNSLAKSKGERKRFRGLFVRIGKKKGYNGYVTDTILLHNIIDLADNHIVTDHVWFTFTKSFEDAGIREGDTIEFEARVKEYRKGYVNNAVGLNTKRTDYKLSHPTKISVVKSK
jgi:hypothetical protein